MKKIVFLMPVYNDWESFTKLLDEINLVIEDVKEFCFDCIAINDFSTIELPIPPDAPVIIIFLFFKSIII